MRRALPCASPRRNPVYLFRWWLGDHWRVSAAAMTFLSQHDPFADATALIADFGPTANLEAAARASRSRDLGNVVHFCRWRQVERMIVALADEGVSGTVH
jgi:hypothetical protein